jgi:hypothetical protein
MAEAEKIGDASPLANLPEKKRTQFSLTREEMKNGIGSSLS